MGVSLVGAISGTVAWYQYSTRSTVSFVGTSVATSENLLVSLTGDENDFVNDLSHSAVALRAGNTQLAPITTGAIDEDDDLPAAFKAQPIYQKFGYDNWLNANASSYVQFTVYIKLNKMNSNGQSVAVEEQRKVFLSDLLIQNDNNNLVGDISDAIRVHLKAEHENMLLSKTGDDTDVNGKLDLNGDGKLDTADAAYSFIDYNENNAVAYGDGVQKAYELDDVKDMAGGHYLGTLNSPKAVTFASTEDFEAGVTYYENNGLTQITEDLHADSTKTYYVRQEVLPVQVTIWLEGWQKLEAVKSTRLAANYDLDNSAVDYYLDANLSTPATGSANASVDYYYSSQEAMWDPAKYLGAIFDVGLMFEVETGL